MWTFSDILVEKKKTRLSARAALLFVDLYSAGGSFACGMTFLLLAGAFSGLSLTFAPRPRGNAVIYQHSLSTCHITIQRGGQICYSRGWIFLLGGIIGTTSRKQQTAL